MTWRASLAPLGIASFRWYLLSRFVNLVGSTMGAVALTFAVLEITDSASALGIVLAAHSIPMLVFLLVGGVVADRFGPIRVIQTCNAAAAVSNIAIGALLLSDTATLPLVAALTAINGVAAATAMPALGAMLPRLIPTPHLQQANVLASMLRSSTTILGPTLGGLLVVGVGPGWAIALNGVTFAAAAALLLGVRLAHTPRAGATSAWHDLREGWDYVRSTEWLWVVILAFCGICALHQGGFLTLGPVIAKATSIGVGGWGLILSSEAIGLIITSVALLRIRLERPLLWGMLGTALWGAPMIVLGIHPDLVTMIVAGCVAGMGIEIFGLAWNLALQEHVPPAMLPRAISYDALGSFAAIPLGQLGAGPLASALGTGPVVTGAGVAIAVISLATLASPAVRNLRRTSA